MGRQKENADLRDGPTAHRGVHGRSQAGRGVSRAFSFAFLGPHKVGRRIAPYKRFCRRQKPWRTPSRSEAFRSATARRAALSAEMAEFTSPEHLNLSGTPSGPGRMGTRPISARCRCPCGMRIPWRPATRRGSSYCKCRSGPCPDKRFCLRQKPWRRANLLRPSI